MPANRLGVYLANDPMLEITNILAADTGQGAFHKVSLTLRPICENKVQKALKSNASSRPSRSENHHNFLPTYILTVIPIAQGRTHVWLC
ncbi:unnamed protein product [Protopolystoma xenopodis]|uniref:Uncharacterized protein n=1 Tax=Protopolystoma xenopodis TaxID=117903 RepID=A0A448WUB0_9PLAT|nr:unnamed protein product [Protopolystoma xenopodis]